MVSSSAPRWAQFLRCYRLHPAKGPSGQMAGTERHSMGRSYCLYCRLDQLHHSPCLSYHFRNLWSGRRALPDAYWRPMVHKIWTGTSIRVMVQWSRLCPNLGWPCFLWLSIYRPWRSCRLAHYVHCPWSSDYHHWCFDSMDTAGQPHVSEVYHGSGEIGPVASCQSKPDGDWK